MIIEKIMQDINIDLFGITNKIEYLDILDDLNKYNKENPLEFCSYESMERLDSTSVLADVKSIISILLPYELESNFPMPDNVILPSIVSNNAWEIDYHRQLKDKLEQLASHLSLHYEDLIYECVVDTSPLIDRRIAYEAGIGVYGKNTFLINEKLGSSFYIGSLLVNIELDKKNISSHALESLYKSCEICKECDRCIKYCPGHALKGDYTIDSNKCISYLTQKKAELSYEERKLISNRLYGCDICQIVCPYSKIDFKINDEYKRNSSNVIDAMEVISTSNKQLRKKYKMSGFIWRGPNVLKRNAIVNIGNSKKQAGFDFLSGLYFELSIEHRLYALWSLYVIDEKNFENFIKYNTEKFSIEELTETENLRFYYK